MYTDVVDARQRRFLFALVIAFLMICLSHVPAFAEDESICIDASGQKSIESCTRLIEAELAQGVSADAEKLGQLFLLRGVASAVLEQNEPAISDFTEAIEYDPRLYAAYYQRALTFESDKKSKRAIVDFNIAISLAPTVPEIYLGRGYSRMQLDQFEKAIPDFTKAIELDIDMVSDAYNMRGYAYALSGDTANGLKDFKQAVTLALTTANFRHSLGEGYFYSGSRQKAVVEWKRACQLATGDVTRAWHKSLAKLGYYSGEIDQPCGEHTLKAFEVCAQAKCRF